MIDVSNSGFIKFCHKITINKEKAYKIIVPYIQQMLPKQNPYSK